MSSDSRIAVAKNYLSPDPPGPASEPLDAAPEARPLGGPEPGGPLHPLWRAALETDEATAPASALPSVWWDLVRGRLRVWGESLTADRVLVLARSSDAEPQISDRDAAILARVLCGDQQKVIASELGVAGSTSSSRHVGALARLGLLPRHVPLPLVLAAQGACGIGPIPPSRVGVFSHQRSTCLVVSVRRANASRLTQLTAAEQEVARSIIDGQSRLEVARGRATSVHTVAHQFHAIFKATRSSGRFALVRRAIEMQAFDE